MPTPAEWSVIAMYSCPRARTAATTSSSGCLPSPLQSLCRCMSPRMSATSTSSGSSFAARQLELAVVLAQLRRDRLVAEVAVDLVLVGRAEDLAALDVLDAPLRDAHAAPLGVLAHAHVVALRAREVLQEVAVALERHDAQVELDAVVGHDRGLGRAVAEHLGDERLLDQPGGQRRARRSRRRSRRRRRRSRRGAAAIPPRRRARRPGARAAARARCARGRAPGRCGTRACAARRPPRSAPGAAAPCARRSPRTPSGGPRARRPRGPPAS